MPRSARKPWAGIVLSGHTAPAGDISQAHQPNEFVAKSHMAACDAFMGKMIVWAERQ